MGPRPRAHIAQGAVCGSVGLVGLAILGSLVFGIRPAWIGLRAPSPEPAIVAWLRRARVARGVVQSVAPLELESAGYRDAAEVSRGDAVVAYERDDGDAATTTVRFDEGAELSVGDAVTVLYDDEGARAARSITEALRDHGAER